MGISLYRITARAARSIFTVPLSDLQVMCNLTSDESQEHGGAAAAL
jgi:hypothetical protein